MISKIYNSPTYGIDIILTTVLIGYILFEVGFFFYYKWVLVPYANDQITHRPLAPYRDYPDIKDREKLLIRILDRLDAQVKQENNNNSTSSANNSNNIYYDFIESWFQTKNEDISYDRFSEQFDMATLDVGLCPPKFNMAWSSVGDATSSSLDDETDKSSTESLVELSSSPEETKKTSKGRIQKDNMDEFLSWAFFGLPLSTVQTSTDMQNALNDFYNILSTRTGLTFEPGNNPHFKPRSFTFERVKSLYRPYTVYVGVTLLKMTANIILYILGFRQYTCAKGLRYWHRSSKPRKGSPFLFFHGIAPGGYAPYLPMIFGILKGELSYRHRDLFLFENKPVSYALCFDALSEEDTIHGILEAIDLHLDDPSTSNNLTLFGHSFGSCQIAWMIKSQGIKNRISSIILCDPVSILLSAPDVVVNFLYRRQGLKDSYNGNPNTLLEKVVRFVNETKIHLVASSELFIEHYLRRNFAWYNSELWLEDIPPEVKVLVCLADCDEIVNSPNIEREINYHNSVVSKDSSDDGGGGCSIEKIIWKDVGHAHCMMSKTCFNNIHEAMLRMETTARRNIIDNKTKVN